MGSSIRRSEIATRVIFGIFAAAVIVAVAFLYLHVRSTRSTDQQCTANAIAQVAAVTSADEALQNQRDKAAQNLNAHRLEALQLTDPLERSAALTKDYQAFQVTISGIDKQQRAEQKANADNPLTVKC